jgi:hypothetical protein
MADARWARGSVPVRKLARVVVLVPLPVPNRNLNRYPVLGAHPPGIIRRAITPILVRALRPSMRDSPTDEFRDEELAGNNFPESRPSLGSTELAEVRE